VFGGKIEVAHFFFGWAGYFYRIFEEIWTPVFSWFQVFFLNLERRLVFVLGSLGLYGILSCSYRLGEILG
jgi:hypothetical protein